MEIHGDSRRRANILGAENIDHREKKISYDHISNSAYLWSERVCLIQRMQVQCE
jgi:hypothetical protein